jgi:hypothetical protein
VTVRLEPSSRGVSVCLEAVRKPGRLMSSRASPHIPRQQKVGLLVEDTVGPFPADDSADVARGEDRRHISTSPVPYELDLPEEPCRVLDVPDAYQELMRVWDLDWDSTRATWGSASVVEELSDRPEPVMSRSRDTRKSRRRQV